MMRLPVTPPGFAWHQSRIGQYLRCGREFALEHLLELPQDHRVSGFAAPLGTAAHEVMEAVMQAGPRVAARADISGTLEGAFISAVSAAQEKYGSAYDPDSLDPAYEKMEMFSVLLERFAARPELDALEVLATEHPFEWTDAHGRVFRGTIDLVARARRFVPSFAKGWDGMRDLHEGDLLVVDWKTGDKLNLGTVGRRLNVQLGFYTLAIQRTPWWDGRPVRTFIGRLLDLQGYTRPPGVPSKLKSINPDYLAATGLSEEEARDSRKRPKGVPKWVTLPNPAYEEARRKPRGPFWHECEVDLEEVARTITYAIRGAESGLYPATGAHNDTCGWCPYRGRPCLEATNQRRSENA